MKFAVATLALALLPLSAMAVDAPTGLQGTQTAANTVAWSWSSVDGAARYAVRVNGIDRGQTGDTSLSVGGLHRGEASLEVFAIDGSGAYSAQSQTLKITVGEGAASGQSNQPSQPAEGSGSETGPAPQARARDNSDTGLIDPQTSRYPEAQQKNGYELVFSDEFNGDSLSPARWNTQLRWDGDWNGEQYEYRIINDENQFYVNPLGPDQAHVAKVASAYNPFQFNGEHLAIRAVKNPLKNGNAGRSHGNLDEMVGQQEFLSGVISTYDKFYRKYGYFEASIRIPNHDGTFPAFWLFHQNRSGPGVTTQRTEIDIMENLGHAPWYIYNSFHYFAGANENYRGEHRFVKPTPSGQIYSGTDYSQNFHTYAVKWEPGHIVWYIDDVQVSEVRSGEANFEELYLQINLAMGGKWTNYPENAGGLGRASGQQFPNGDDLANFGNPALEIDFVRVYAPR